MARVGHAARDAIDALAALLGSLDLARQEIAELEQRPTVPRQVDRRDVTADDGRQRATVTRPGRVQVA